MMFEHREHIVHVVEEEEEDGARCQSQRAAAWRIRRSLPGFRTTCSGCSNNLFQVFGQHALVVRLLQKLKNGK